LTPAWASLVILTLSEVEGEESPHFARSATTPNGRLPKDRRSSLFVIDLSGIPEANLLLPLLN
jgi:hypothetical protein